jgi:hypothetical protein
VNRSWSTDGVHDQLECDELADPQAVERRVLTEIGAMEEDLSPVSQTDETVRLTDGDANDRAAGTRAG